MPRGTQLVIGKHVGEDYEKTRADELIGYLVIEAGSGTVGETRYAAGLSAQVVGGVENAPPCAVPYPAGLVPSTAVVAAAAHRLPRAGLKSDPPPLGIENEGPA
ncbi:hypothetical protein [Thiocapsa bogorovii]|uniref:hypothetical protein n=1 Tax=Thiocapsa bogorovii TaxID=521689 RepID=UPI001E500CE0|nr:hypothetical protein [Thiocapsa bogorovii]UHD15892.1 hypothetical protein LT988_21980 [Thiocapsa bogorovii]